MLYIHFKMHAMGSDVSNDKSTYIDISVSFSQLLGFYLTLSRVHAYD